jgi:nucleoside recognition membrane protein YjiH
MFLCFLTTAVVSRLYPLNRKPSVYESGRKQTEDDVANDKNSASGNPLRIGFSRAVKKGYVAPPIANEIVTSLKAVFYVMPKVFSLMTAVCVSAMVLAFYTPVFNWIGLVFRPLLALLQVAEASSISHSFAVGIAEMFLPVLMISDNVEILSEGARFMVAAVSMVQIIFFSDSACVMLALKMPVSFKDLVIIFFERTIVAIILVAPMMHLLF